MKTAIIGNALGLILVALGLIMLAPVAVALLAMEFTAIHPFVVAAAVSAGWAPCCAGAAAFPAISTASGAARACSSSASPG